MPFFTAEHFSSSTNHFSAPHKLMKKIKKEEEISQFSD
jgi:hypothetical protein